MLLVNIVFHLVYCLRGRISLGVILCVILFRFSDAVVVNLIWQHNDGDFFVFVYLGFRGMSVSVCKQVSIFVAHFPRSDVASLDFVVL